MEKLLIDFDDNRYSRQIGSYELFKNLIGQAIQIFNSFNIGSFDPVDLKNLILFPEVYVTNKLLESKDITPLIKMGLARHKIIDMLSMPAELPTLLEKIIQLERIFQQQIEVNHLTVSKLEHLLTYYHFNEGNELVLNETVSDNCRHAAENYIETKQAKNLFSFASEMILLYEKYNIKVATPADNAKLIEYLFKIKNDCPVVNINCILDTERRCSK